ncbi:hypothetical protein [Exiguobacterium sp. JLM-2]|uniref:hypothetical protein n=1 Tax=Exiguobacterium sp. JLM-2 TaxID=1647415 RepID=UPI000649983A|nr:hypothetical protein [Exiguobacterium sp. JLM-2]
MSTSESFILLEVDVLVIRVLSLGEHMGVSDNWADTIVEFLQLTRLADHLLDADETVELVGFLVERAYQVSLR